MEKSINLLIQSMCLLISSSYRCSALKLNLSNNNFDFFIFNVEVEGGIVDELQNLQSLLTRNYVTERKQYADALKSITSELCETRRKVNLNNLR